MESRRRSRRLAERESSSEDEALERIQKTVIQHASFFSSDSTDAPCAKHVASSRQPVSPPDFTIGTLRKAIPPHCFERSLASSLAYLALDLAMIAALYVFSTKIDTIAPCIASYVSPVPMGAVKAVMWGIYWFFQGAVSTGVWVIAHECGHQAFSKYQLVNDGIGLVCHSLLLVPYYSWKFSHARHHANTGSVAKDEVFVPTVKGRQESEWSVEQFGPYRLVKLAGSLTLGWPLYLLFNVKSRPYEGHSWVNHFDPWSPIFSKRQRVEILVSDVALGAVVYGLYAAGEAWGWSWLCRTYVVPYLIVNFWLVMITLLQHTHPDLPHYTDDSWEWLRGALATVDRNYGWVLNALHHHIADTHVVHHLFSQMPHYHAQEATEAVRPVLGSYYRKDDRFIFRALWEDYKDCRYVCEDFDAVGSGILWQRP
jgi:omega-6 fatty acid desaturase (delta-12 desaturase)